MHSAVFCGLLPVVRALVSNGADINARDKRGVTPLLALARGNNPFIMYRDANKSSSSGAYMNDAPALVMADPDIWKTAPIYAVMNEVLEKGADVNAQDAMDGKTVLHLLSTSPFNFKLIEWLIEEHKANIEIV